MNVLIVAALTKATGNAVTAERIAAHLATMHRVVLCDASTASAREVRALVRAGRIDSALGVHALLAGGVLRVLEIPYTLVFGGTDLYEAAHPLHQKQMASAVAAAQRLVAFSEENRSRAVAQWRCDARRIGVVPQAVDVSAVDTTFSLRRHLGLAGSDAIVLVPASLRRVKDPLFAAAAFAQHAASGAHVVVVGASLETDWAREALASVRAPNVHVLPELARPQLLAAIREADVVLNTSLSEGMCGTVLEAMALGTPVVARRNAGNESLVVSGDTGILFETASELVRAVDVVRSDVALRARIVRNAFARVAKVHGCDAERAAYLAVVGAVAKAPRRQACCGEDEGACGCRSSALLGAS